MHNIDSSTPGINVQFNMRESIILFMFTGSSIRYRDSWVSEIYGDVDNGLRFINMHLLSYRVISKCPYG